MKKGTKRKLNTSQKLLIALVIGAFIIITLEMEHKPAPSRPAPRNTVEKVITNEEVQKQESQKQEEASEKKSLSVAAVCAKREVKTLLKAPSSAKFPWQLLAHRNAQGEIVSSNYVDSQNSFGATIRTNYDCTIEIVDEDNFNCNTTCMLY